MSSLDKLIQARDEVTHILETETMSAEQRERLEAIQELTNHDIEVYGKALDEWSLELKAEAERRKNAK